MQAWFAAHIWWFLGGLLGFITLVMERLAFRRGVTEGTERARRTREAQERTQEIARRSWDALRQAAPKPPPQEMSFSGQTGYTVMAIKDAEGKPVVRVVFRLPASDASGGAECVIQFNIGPAEAEDMASTLRTAAGHADKACDTRPTAWDRIDNDPV